MVALPWYIAVQLRNPEFFRVFILEHNLARFGKDVYHHTEPFWYYLPVALLGLVPWTMFVAAAVVDGVRDLVERKRKAEKGEMLHSNDALPAFLVIWLRGTDCIFFIFGVEAAGIHSAGPACGHAAAGGICATARDRQ